MPQAAERTRAWIITGGTNEGVMKMVGEMLQESEAHTQTVCLGITTWGTTYMHEKDRMAAVGRHCRSVHELGSRGVDPRCRPTRSVDASRPSPTYVQSES